MKYRKVKVRCGHPIEIRRPKQPDTIHHNTLLTVLRTIIYFINAQSISYCNAANIYQMLIIVSKRNRNPTLHMNNISREFHNRCSNALQMLN